MSCWIRKNWLAIIGFLVPFELVDRCTIQSNIPLATLIIFGIAGIIVSLFKEPEDGYYST